MTDSLQPITPHNVSRVYIIRCDACGEEDRTTHNTPVGLTEAVDEFTYDGWRYAPMEGVLCPKCLAVRENTK